MQNDLLCKTCVVIVCTVIVFALGCQHRIEIINEISNNLVKNQRKGPGNHSQTCRHATDRGILPDMLSYELLVHACEQLGQTDTQIQMKALF